MARLLRNPNQTNESQTYIGPKGDMVVVSRKGYYFSDDDCMTPVIDYFEKNLGFVEVDLVSNEDKVVASKPSKRKKRTNKNK